MKQLAALMSILWRATLFLPVAVLSLVFVLAYFLLPFEVIVYALFVSGWYWLGLPLWAASLYFLRKPLQALLKSDKREAGLV
jgi:hypothetical protein